MDDPPPSGLDEDVKAQLDVVYRGYGGEYAARWDLENPGNRASAAELSSTVQALTDRDLPVGGLVLDVGAGANGSFPTLFADVQRIQLDILEWRLRETMVAGVDGTAICGDGSSLPIRTASVGAVLLSTVLSSVSEQIGAAMLGEVTRVLADGGMLVIYDFRVPNPRNRSTRAVRRAWIKEALVDFDVEVRSVTVVPQLARRLGSMTKVFYPVLARVPLLRTHNVLVAVRRR